MDKRILLISQAQGFMVNAMVKSLRGEDFEVLVTEPKVNAISQMESLGDIVLVYLDGVEDFSQDFLVYLKDLITEQDGVFFFLIGNVEELDLAKKTIPEHSLHGCFTRPLNVRELVDRIGEVAADVDHERAKKHILVVDDDPTMLRTLRLWLSDKYRVYMANSGMNALSLLAKNQVDLILLDYEMPVASGPQVLEMIRSEPSTADTPVMFLTAKNDKESVMSVVGLKPEKYLLKTMPPDVLMENIDNFFEAQKGKQ
ncbi:MAG: response regulator [Lachnospiraceae bacterium]|nr:response regulator [Lachnospiraceae bacterium]